LHGQDPRLARVDDRVAEQRPEGARVVDREGGTGKLVSLQLLGLRPARQVVDGPCEARDGEAVGFAYDRHEQRVLESDGDAEVDVTVDDQLGLVEGRVELRMLAQRGDGDGRDVWQ